MTIDIPDHLFKPVGEDVGAAAHAWLRAVVTIRGVCHHLEAIAVEDHDSFQGAEAAKLEEALDSYAEAAASDRPFDTVPIGSRRYVLVMTPFSAGTLR